MLTISIITATYQAGKFLDRCIQSVLEQKNIQLDYILIDGGSTDDTLSIISKYKDRISYFISEPDKGIYDALNKGIRAAKGEIVGFLHADDYFVDEFVLFDVLQAFVKNQTDLVYGNIRYVKAERTVRNWVSKHYDPCRMYFGWMPPHTGLFCKKKVYDRCGVFRLDMRISADYEFMLRIFLICQCSSSYIDRYIVHMEVGGKSNVSFQAKMTSMMEDWKAWFIHKKYITIAPICKPLRKIGQFISNT